MSNIKGSYCSSGKNISNSTRDKNIQFSKYLEGVVFVLSGFVNPERSTLRSKALEMGAIYKPDWTSDCTLLICAFPNTPKFRQVEANNGTIVSKGWISECYNQKKLVEIDQYLMHAGNPWRKNNQQKGKQDLKDVQPQKSQHHIDRTQSMKIAKCETSKIGLISSDEEYVELSPKKTKKRKLSSGVGSTSTAGSVMVYRSLGLEKGQTIERIVRERRTQKIKQTTMEDHLKKQEKKDVHKYIAKFFYDNSIAFHVVQSESFECMLEAVGRYGRNCKPPTPYGLGTPLLNDQMKAIDVIRKRHEKAWIESGCTLMSDGWTDRRRRNIINFLVNSVAGTFYLHSIDASNQEKTTEFIADGLENAMKIIGPQHVVQICTDNAPNYVRAGKLLTEKYKHLFWTPCAAHVMDLILEDIGKIPQYKNAIRNAVKITNHVYNHATLHSKLLETTKGKELVRSGVTRFATSYLTLKSLQEQSEVLRTFNWRPWVRKGDGLKVADLVVNTRFWMTVEDCLKASEPILVVLRLVDSDSKPNLPSLAAAFLKAKDAIMTNFQNIERDYMPILKILESRWSKHFQSPLFKTATFLNPGVYYKIKSSCSIQEIASYEEAFQDCMEKMIDDDQVRTRVVMDSYLYKNKRGRFGLAIAKLAVDSSEPIMWWDTYGTSTTELRRYAMRILALCVSASSCERNWSLVEHIHSKKRNRLNSKRLDRLVYITYNRKLDQRTQRHRLLELKASPKYDPIRVDSMNFNSEWMTGIEGAADEFVYTEADGLTWAQVEEVSGVAEQPGPSTRSGQTRGFTYQRTRTSFREMGTESQYQMVMDEIEENIRDHPDNCDIGARCG